MQIRVQGPTYFSQNDETAMFEWLGRMAVLRDVTGEGHDLIIRLKRAPTDNQLRDLLALFFRYQMDMRRWRFCERPRMKAGSQIKAATGSMPCLGEPKVAFAHQRLKSCLSPSTQEAGRQPTPYQPFQVTRR